MDTKRYHYNDISLNFYRSSSRIVFLFLFLAIILIALLAILFGFFIFLRLLFF